MRMHIGRGLGLLAVLVLANATARAADVEVKVVKYPGLEETVKQLRGKVVVVDCWADT